MNRFEQKSMSLGRRLIYLLPILAFVILFVLFLRGIGSVSESTLSKPAGKSGNRIGTQHFPVLCRRRLLSSFSGISGAALRTVV